MRVPYGRRSVLFLPDLRLIRSAALAACFFIGAVVAFRYAREGIGIHDELLRSFFSEYGESASAFGSSGSAVLYYLAFPLVLFLFGFSAFGVVLIPAAACIYGFLSMYSVAAMSLAFGRAGVALAAALFLLRFLFTLPCFFVLAGEVWPLSAALAALSVGRGKRGGDVLYDGACFRVFAVCVVILSVGVLAERILTPVLFRMVWEKAMF